MDLAWEASWAWGFGLIAVTIAVHALGIALLSTVLHRVGAAIQRTRRRPRFPMLFTANLLGCVGLALAVLHGIGASIWAIAHLRLGRSGRCARRCSIRSTRSLPAAPPA